MSEDAPFLLPYQRLFCEQVPIALEEMRAGGNSQGVLLWGPSGNGKTFTLDQLAMQHLPYIDGVQRCTPLVRVSTKAGDNAASVMAAILSQLGMDKHFIKGMKNPQLEVELHKALSAHRTRIVIFEEFTSALLADKKEFRQQMARFLKNLWNMPPTNAQSWANADISADHCKLVVILSGTEELKDAIDRDRELWSRFSCVIKAESVGFYPPDKFEQFRLVLSAMAARVGLGEFIDVSDINVSARTLVACEGHLRILEKILQRTSSLVRRGAEGTALVTLTQAFTEVGGGAGRDSNAFEWPNEKVARKVEQLQREAGAPRRIEK